MLRPRHRVLLLLTSLPLLALGVGAKTTGPLVNDLRQMLVMSNGKPVRLQNNPNARDVPLARVLAFVAANRVNRQRYVDGKHMCAEYAVTLHDRAEASGIRCALVSLSFAEGVGHALNAFQTTDRGLVYIDCTGGPEGDADDAYDTVGYIQIGKPYGRLHVGLGSRWPSEYGKYQEALTVFRNISAWDKELSNEYHAIEENLLALKSHRSNPEVYRASAAAVQARVDKYNRLLAYRNEFAKTFRLRYGENTAAVTRVDVFW